MDKLKMKSKDLTKENIEKIEELFPNVITETKDENGNITKAIDFELLQQELSNEIVEGSKERYQLTWPGKKEAIVTANTPIDKTLRPVKEDSLNWEDTENLYIEGDNLEVLKLLQESYLGKIKCIYIDPPYNTGNDFIYRDNFAQDRDEYAEESGQVDEEGNRLFQNTEYNGRYHSDWLSMMYPRLKLARNLLSEDGVIFISIDDHEVHNLRKICDEIFGERNFVTIMTWVKKKKGSHLSKTIRSMTEYILVYGKNYDDVELFGEEAYSDKWQPLAKRTNAHKNLSIDENVILTTLADGIYQKGFYGKGSSAIEFLNDFAVKDGIITNDIIVKGPFVWTQEKLNYELKIGTKISLSSKFGFNVFRSNQEEKIKRPTTILDHKLKIGTNEDAYSELKDIFKQEKILDYPKPISLIKYIIYTLGFFDKDMLTLDFFSGSATTAHAVMDLNAEDGGNRKYIMVQLPEPCDEKSEAYKSGYKNICEIGKERIRRAGKKIKEETGADIDYGFRVYKVDSTNMKDVYYRPDELDQDLIEQLESNIKEDRTGLDLLTQVMLETGLELSLPMETREIRGKEVYFVAGNSLVACFDEDVDEGLIKEIAKNEPLKVVFRDNSFKSCPEKINLEEIFKGISPNTDIRVL
ncbi:MAG: Adenine specific DNA methylase Mod [Sporanaerobacter sp.]|jgi:adenine-specific DNA-methyltransferase|uniref:site-specific DNA-methyltransferase n=1 Tax=Sporanaerobacter sp. TaxID=2010183 RepID=UPI003A0FDBEC